VSPGRSAVARRARRDEAGFTGVEALLLLPLVALFVDFVFFCGRAGLAREDVYGAARDAARAASVAPLADAPSAASQAASVSLSSGQAVCPNPVVQTDISHFLRGGVVTVTVTCQIAVSDLDLLGVPGSTTLQSSYTEAVDPLTAADG
jgi:Flp pilus assembly protein TadG